MKHRLISVIVLAALVLCLLAGCGDVGSDVLTQEEARQIALAEVGLSEKDVDDIHTHVATYEDKPSFSIHITVGDREYELIIDAVTGEVLYSGDSTH